MDRFNRYMVECEFLYCTNKWSNIDCFNRYMVECEYQEESGKHFWSLPVLIDTWWNVNQRIYDVIVTWHKF